MQLRHIKTIKNPHELKDMRFQKITAIDWCPSALRLAVATVDRYIVLFDENGTVKDKFSTKPGDRKGPRNYIVRGLAFSPDSTKLAVAQSDNIIFVYKLGSQWGDKKTICNKFTQPSSVTSLRWPTGRNELVFGLADGKLRIGICRNNKSATLYNTDTCVVSVASNTDGQSVVSGHLDGNIYRYTFPDQEGPMQGLLTHVDFVPYCLGWGEHIVAAGNTAVVKFFNPDGKLVQQFDYSGDEHVKEFSSLAFNPSGQTVVIGNFDRFYIYVYDANALKWNQTGVTVVENLYTVTALAWKSDGSRLATGSLCGAVDIYDACIRRSIYRGKYEFTYTSLSSVIVKKLADGRRTSLQSRFRCEITKVNIYSDRFIVCHTPETLIMADWPSTGEAKISEIPWNGSGKEKFFFDNENACMVFNAGELSLVEYGENDVLGSLRTEYMSPHLISLRLGDARNTDERRVKKIAYLLDNQAVSVLDLTTGIAEATYSHDCKIDWLELNQRATKLLFRDKRRALHLYDIASQTRITMLNFCNYVQWVPDSDVVVAQNRRQLCVWYSIHNTSDVTTFDIKGDVEEIERAEGHTQVIVDEGIKNATYKLDEQLISFGAAIDSKSWTKAADMLEEQTHTVGTDAMWNQLSELALNGNDLAVAERCFAALGDVARTNFMRNISKIILETGDKDHYRVRAQLFILQKQFKRAEMILLQNGQTADCINMYRQLHMWEDALNVAEQKGHPSALQIRKEYFDYLTNTKQEEVAGDLKEKEGDSLAAIHLFLQGGYPAKAADLVLKHEMQIDNNLCDRIADALVRTRQFEKAGEFLEFIGLHKRALECYCRGHSFIRAVELARTQFPAQVVGLEQDWGDWLAQQKQMDAASNHYIQAGAYLKAINAAIEARQWSKAVQILDQIDNQTAKPYFKRIAQHYAETKRYPDAEKYFIAGDLPEEAVQMYTAAGQWDKAHKIAKTYMPDSEIAILYVTQAQVMESQGKYKEAERLYLTVDEPDLAISMYKKNRQYDDMIRLVGQCRKELLNETHFHLASQFQTEANFKLAEKHYLEAKDWKAAVSMYRENNLWEDCLRVSQQHGGQNAYKQVAYAFAISVGGDAGVKLLAKRGLGEQAVDYAIERSEFQEAFHIAEKSCKHKIPEVHLQYAMALEDEGRFEKAEEEFIKAKKPKEAIDMYIHQQDFEAGMRVAEQHEPAAIADVQEAKARKLAEDKQHVEAENLFIQAKKPEMAIKMYKDAAMWDDAIRLAKKFLPRMVFDLQQERVTQLSSEGASESPEGLLEAARLYESQKDYPKAIASYLKLTKEQCGGSFTVNDLVQAWETAVSIAMDFTPNRANEVVSQVTRRLVEINKHDEAADMHLSMDNWEGAIDVFLACKKFDQALTVAQGSNNPKHWVEYVRNSQTQGLISENRLADLGEVNRDAAIEMYVLQGNWDQVYQLAQAQGEAEVVKFASIHAKQLVQDGKYRKALEVLSFRGVSCVPANFSLYRRIAQEILAFSEETQEVTQHEHTELPPQIAMLREILYKLMGDLREVDPDGQTTKQFERMSHIAHFYALKAKCQAEAMHMLEGRLATSLLRYVDIIPVDRAFHEAGFANLRAGLKNMTFVFLNRYVDLSDLIEEPDNGALDNTDFLGTDIPLLDVPLPAKQFCTSDLRDEARDWVLDAAMSNSVSQALNQRLCRNCNTQTYEAAIECHKCKKHAEVCMVSGYPVNPAARVQCTSCHCPANRDDWNMYVSKAGSCPWCGNGQKSQYESGLR